MRKRTFHAGSVNVDRKGSSRIFVFHSDCCLQCPIEIRFSGNRCADASGVRIPAGLRPDICSPLGLRKRRRSASFRAQAVSCLLI